MQQACVCTSANFLTSYFPLSLFSPYELTVSFSSLSPFVFSFSPVARGDWCHMTTPIVIVSVPTSSRSPSTDLSVPMPTIREMASWPSMATKVCDGMGEMGGGEKLCLCVYIVVPTGIITYTHGLFVGIYFSYESEMNVLV